MSTPPPPKPWERAEGAALTPSSSSKDTPLANAQMMKPWDVPGAGETPSGR
ncbi:predicted protein [Bathycoccus prasinos]|uniref:Peroxin-13 n=1 Tax=Bathycoccus prasinos TaxID=41875 RepID=K8F148_9CHLO|nr:predicted protein [Bathycoccus prasinos]CCO18510.1 predicted protein [Bathycoccus prasinos]|eukprot:XP_007510165.1 predicted protein [Bathycoccus prasinos]